MKHKKLNILFLFTVLFLLYSCSSIPMQPNENNIKPNVIAAQYNMELGLAYLQQGDRPRAKHKLLLALNQAPNSAAVQDAMAYFMEMTGATVEAEKYYLRAIKLAPAQGAPLNNYGVFLCQEGHYAASETQFIAASKDPDYLEMAKVYENAGLCMLAMHDRNKARFYFQQAIKQDPDCKTAWIELAKISYDVGNIRPAQQD